MITIKEQAPAVAPQADQTTQQVNAILTRTNWNGYWNEVSKQVNREVEAYDSARARSFATASRRFLR